MFSVFFLFSMFFKIKKLFSKTVNKQALHSSAVFMFVLVIFLLMSLVLEFMLFPGHYPTVLVIFLILLFNLP